MSVAWHDWGSAAVSMFVVGLVTKLLGDYLVSDLDLGRGRRTLAARWGNQQLPYWLALVVIAAAANFQLTAAWLLMSVAVVSHRGLDQNRGTVAGGGSQSGAEWPEAALTVIQCRTEETVGSDRQTSSRPRRMRWMVLLSWIRGCARAWTLRGVAVVVGVGLCGGPMTVWAAAILWFSRSVIDLVNHPPESTSSANFAHGLGWMPTLFIALAALAVSSILAPLDTGLAIATLAGLLELDEMTTRHLWKAGDDPPHWEIDGGC